MAHLIDNGRAWGRSMMREFAAKQQLVPHGHMFSDIIGAGDLRQLRALATAIRAIESGACDADALTPLLTFDGDIATAGAMLEAAIGPLSAEEAGFALALAYLPFETVDAFAVSALRGGSLKQIASAIDPREVLTPHTRLFVADHLRKDKSLHCLLSATAAMAALRENSAQVDAGGLCTPAARERLRRLGAATDGYLAAPPAFAAALRACLAHDWRGAEAQALQVAAGKAEPTLASEPPAFADLLLISLLPSCDTIDAVKRLTAAARTSASRACAADDR